VLLHIIGFCRLLDVLREDNRAVVRAASQASKAADFLLRLHSRFPLQVRRRIRLLTIGRRRDADLWWHGESERWARLSATGLEAKRESLGCPSWRNQMTKAVHKIHAVPRRGTFPSTSSVLSQSNVRRVEGRGFRIVAVGREHRSAYPAAEPNVRAVADCRG